MAADEAISSAAGGAAAGAAVAGPWGAVIGGAAGLIGGLMGGKSAKKEAAQAREMLDLQLKELEKNRKRADAYIAQRKGLLTQQLAQQAATKAELTERRNAAFKEGNDMLAANLNSQLQEVEKGRLAQELEINAAKAAEQGIISDREIAASQSLGAQQAKEEGAQIAQNAENEKLRKAGLVDVEGVQSTAKAELARVAGSTTPEGLNAMKSQIEGQAAQAGADMKRQAALTGKPGASSGANLALALGKLKTLASTSADFMKGFAATRAGNIALLSNAVNQGTQARMALKSDLGDKAAERARYYGTEERKISTDYGNQMLASESAAGGRKIGLATNTAAARLAATETEAQGRLANLQQKSAGDIADITGNAAAVLGIQDNADAAERAALGMQASATSEIGKAYGASAESARSTADRLYGNASQAMGQGIATIGSGIGKMIDEKKKKTTVG